MVLEVLLLLVAFVAIWLSTGFAIESLEKLSIHSTVSRFTLSLFVIGIITSFPEMAIMFSSLSLNSPQIALGSLIGSQVFLLFFVIPLLAIITKGIQVHMQMKNMSLALTLLVASIPIAALLNQGLELSEVVIILGAYVIFVAVFFRRKNFLESMAARLQHPVRVNVLKEVAKLLGAVLILLIASNTAVREMIEIAAFLETPRFLLSMLILPIGTNLPEISLALSSIVSGKKEFALGDYMGAITFNSVLIGVLTLSSGGTIAIDQNISLVILSFIVGVIGFWWCCFSREYLSIKEGLSLLCIYFLLLLVATGQIMAEILG